MGAEIPVTEFVSSTWDIDAGLSMLRKAFGRDSGGVDPAAPNLCHISDAQDTVLVQNLVQLFLPDLTASEWPDDHRLIPQSDFPAGRVPREDPTKRKVCDRAEQVPVPQ
jgi:hypothetical protein